MNFIAIPATIDSIRTRKDKTMSIVIATQEMEPNKAGQLLSMHGKLGYICIKPENFTKQELEIIDMLKTDEGIGKTPSQRLRSVLYISWKEDNKGFEDFSNFYVHHMEKIIQHYKDKLP